MSNLDKRYGQADTLFKQGRIDEAVDMARGQGKSFGLLVLNTIWPFPYPIILKHAREVRKIIVVEQNMGQLVHKVLEYVQGICDVKFIGKIGGELPTPEDIMFENLPRLGRT